MAKPIIAIVGRPNVGKSTFFNKLAGERIAIVQDVPGVTRDRILADAEWCGRSFTVIDTGGIEPRSQDPMQSHIRAQADIAIETADVILFFTDGRQGLTADDREVADILRKCGKPVLVAVNKLDRYDPSLTYEFYELGFEHVFGVSSEQGSGVGDLLDETVRLLPESDEEVDDGAIKIAVVGKPNAGKSSLVNRLTGEDRVIVSDIAGTTRDCIDTPVTVDGQAYVLIDTAGLRRKRGVESGSVEAISAIKAMRAIEKADVVLIVIDAGEELSEQDIRVAGYVHESGKPSVIVVNKWDLVEKDTHTIERYRAGLNESLKFMDYYESVFISAKTGQRVTKIWDAVAKVYASSNRRIPTGQLNDLVSDAVALTEPPAFSGRRLKIMYATQAGVCPPTFVFFVNDATLMHFSYLRYLENSLRKTVDFTGTPIRLEVRTRSEKKS